MGSGRIVLTGLLVGSNIDYSAAGGGVALVLLRRREQFTRGV